MSPLPADTPPGSRERETVPSRKRDPDTAFGAPMAAGSERYVVIEAIGAGGMGQVWAAYDRKLNRKVALKLLLSRPEVSARQREVSQERLLREAKALAQLSHPNIITVHDVDTWEGQLFMAMEFVDGQTLGDWVETLRPPWRDILRVYTLAGRGLAAAHAQGIIHRDFKPGNVLLGRDGRVRVLDFGLAKSHGRASGEGSSPVEGSEPWHDERTSDDVDEGLTQAGRILGTPAYMAPEQMESGGRVGTATDQFSFAVSLYESLYGQSPFPGASRRDRYRAIRRETFRDVPSSSEVPPWVYRVLKRALKPNPADRFASMDALLHALARDPRKRWRQWGQVSAVAALGGLAAAALMVGVARRATPCHGAEDRWEDIWAGSERVALQSALGASELSYAADTSTRVLSALDAYGQRWIRGRTEVCLATRVHREQSEALLDARMNCLDRRLSEVDALIGVLTRSDASIVERAVAAVHRLPPPETCQQAEIENADVLPTDVRTRDRVVRVRTELDHVQALLMAGRYRDAAEQATRARTSAEIVDHQATLARALLAEGRAYRFASQPTHARDALQSAISIGATVGLADVEALAWINLVYLAGVDQNDPVTADAWRLAARSALTRAGNPADLRLALRLNEGAVDLKANRFEDAREAHLDVLDLGRSLGRPQENPNVAMAWMNLGVIAARLNQHAEAEAALRRVLELNRELLGPLHPAVADAALNLANILLRNGDLEDAETFAGQALSIRERARGSYARDVLEARNTLAVVYMQRERWSDAEALLHRSLTSLRDQGPSDLLGMLLNNLGAVAAGRGDIELALGMHQDALTVLQTLYGDAESGRLPIARTRMRLCQVAPKAGDPAPYLEMCNLALVVLEDVYEGPNDDIISLYAARASVHESLGEFEAARLDRAQVREMRQGRAP